MTKVEKELLDKWFENVDLKLDAIHTQAKLTNSRVTKLEDQTEEMRFFKRHPKIFILVLVLFLAVLKFEYIVQLIKILI